MTSCVMKIPETLNWSLLWNESNKQTF